jgi:hypothetical protein
MHLFRRKARPKVKLLPRQKIWLAIVIITNLALWLIPSDVVEDIARDRHTMLGRYSRQHFTWNVAIGLISIVSFYIDWSKGETYKRRWFQVIAVTTFAVPGLILLDFFLRTPETGHYIKTSLAFHHPPDGSWGREFVDKPEAHRTYPNAPPGYGSLDCTLHTDSRGFRNTTEHEQYDVVAIGDSFTEGSNVSDEHPWPQQLADISGLRVYNMGMSGYDPIHYLAALQEHALPLKPKIVLCMIYEGNDFRSAKADQKRTAPSLSSRFKEYLKQSPILATTDRFLIDTFGPINSTGHGGTRLRLRSEAASRSLPEPRRLRARQALARPALPFREDARPLPQGRRPVRASVCTAQSPRNPPARRRHAPRRQRPHLHNDEVRG